MKEFAVYTLLRLLLLAGAFGITIGIWSSLSEDGSVQIVWAVIIAFAVSGIASYFLLDPYRRRFAQKVEDRASAAARRFEEKRAAEDAEDADKDA
ncbi:MAG TPA: DUF4229 domain-containing protein [Nocardioides sp.]